MTMANHPEMGILTREPHPETIKTNPARRASQGEIGETKPTRRPGEVEIAKTNPRLVRLSKWHR
jgi:hypothetical protein